MLNVREFSTAKPIDLVPLKPQAAVLRSHLRVPRRRRDLAISEVMLAVHLNHDARAVSEQKQEVHSLPRQDTIGTPL